MKTNLKIKIIYLYFFLFFLFPLLTYSANEGEVKNFFIDKDYDRLAREETSAVLEKISQWGYFYLEKEWLESLKKEEKKVLLENLAALAQEFDLKIYPQLTYIFGKEWAPGIDYDYHITILFHQMKEEAGGYFNNGNEYPKLQNPKSNEREMVYLNAEYLFSPRIKSFLAHELLHLITFNQKEKLRGVQEEVWLNEARAEIAPTILGYDKEFSESNLQQRVKQFLASPSDSLTFWKNEKSDYGVVNLFSQYLLDHYGLEILTESLKSIKVGIPSLNEALKERGFKEDFSQVFTDWTIAIYLNNCDFGPKYCYKNENLKNLRVTPSLIFLPPTQKTEFSLNYAISQWSGHWYKIMGGEGELKIKFLTQNNFPFKIPYLACQDNIICQVQFLELKGNEGEIFLEQFGKEATFLTLIPSLSFKTSGFSDSEELYPFSLIASLKTEAEREKLIKELLAKIEFLKAEIARLQYKIPPILVQQEAILCRFENNLFYGILNNPEVRCLQKFLKAQGPEIYPEGLITGNFLDLTKLAVIRFQERYASEILAPWGLKKGTGYVGPVTRAKMNQLLQR